MYKRQAFIILDIDYFKSVNDNFGHIVGDKVLQTFGRFLQSQFREYDVVGLSLIHILRNRKVMYMG